MDADFEIGDDALQVPFIEALMQWGIAYHCAITGKQPCAVRSYGARCTCRVEYPVLSALVSRRRRQLRLARMFEANERTL